MTFEERRQAWEKFRLIAASLPKVEFVMARQPDPGPRSWPPPEPPRFIIVDYFSLLW
jgi:hypothetical protein